MLLTSYCVSPIVAKDLCFKSAEVGEGQNYTARWYFDTQNQRCRQFYYGGYGGNDNNFVDEQSCMARCENRAPATEAPQQPPRRQEPIHQDPPRESGQFSSDSCFHDTDAGECRDDISTRWYYNRAEGICDVFSYGGCGGNQNNFMTREECEHNCGNVQNACELPPVYGRCQENTTRYYYDARSDACETFAFSGCRGNKNNFYTEHECRQQCQQRREEPRTQAPAIDEV